MAAQDIAPVNTAQLDTSAKTTEPLEAAEGFPACVLLTEPILSGQTASSTIDSVKFIIKSNDQGWCSEDCFDGIYEGSWTWFEVAILRSPQPEEVTISSRDRRSIHTEPCIKQALDTKNISTDLRFYTRGENGSIFWHLQRNRRGVDEPQEHIVTWTRECKESTNERLGWDFNPENGAGSGKDFISSLQEGDRVVVIARAKQSGSVNYVSEAAIEIYVGGPGPVRCPTQEDPKSPNMPSQMDALGLNTQTLGNPAPEPNKPESPSQETPEKGNETLTQKILGLLPTGTNLLNANVDPPAASKPPAESTPAAVNTPENLAADSAQAQPMFGGPVDSGQTNGVDNNGTQSSRDDSTQRGQDNLPAPPGIIKRVKIWAKRSILRRNREELGDVKQVAAGLEAGPKV